MDRQEFVWKQASNDRTYELLMLVWIRVGDVFIVVLCHPPKLLYTTEALLNYIEAFVEEVSRDYPNAQREIRINNCCQTMTWWNERT